MAIKLIIQSTENLPTQELVCEQSLITFGRSKNCTVNLEESGISRHHFIIRYSENNYVIIDEGSRAGTLLDNTQLDPKNCYQLGASHEIIVPGFIINLINDGQPPRQERTTVMARKLMDKILDEAHDSDNLPRLRHSSKNVVFYFQNDKASFVLGTLAHLDFVVDDDEEGVAHEHVTFIRDISGVRIIPLLGALTKLNNKEISEAELLNHNDIINLGSLIFIYQDYHDENKPNLEPAQPVLVPTSEELFQAAAVMQHAQPKIIDKLDRICWGLWLVSALGASWIAFTLLFAL